MVREPTQTDRLVGNRIRIRREALRISQTELGSRIGVTSQQIQKYELGKNRLGASRLEAIATVLQVPIAYFFDHVAPPADAGFDDSGLTALLAERGAVDLLRAFADIRDSKLRRVVIDLLRAMGRDDGEV